MKALFHLLARLLSLGYDYRIAAVVRRLLDEAHSHAAARLFKSAGEGFYLERPANLHGCRYISVGKNFRAFARLRLEAYDRHLEHSYTPSISIGDNVSINFDCHIGAINRIEIGNNVLMASKIFITDHYHGEINAEALKTPPSERKVCSRGAVVIEDNVWIGEGVVILPGVVIGKNCIVGANSVVNRSLPQNAIAAGNPAKVIKILE
jgi:acetyltransferase-like isoleucine patch superfamily enzyme